MGHKISPKALRVGYIQDWDSKWFSPKNMADLIEEDFRIRKFLKEKYKAAALAKVGIERTGKFVFIKLHTARPGIIIGKGGADIEQLKKELKEMTSSEVNVDVKEVKRPELDAQLVAESVAFQLERQIAFRRAMKRTVERSMSAGAGGVKIMVAGRIGGAEIARTEWIMEGRVPLHTLRADIDYGFAEAHITMGCIGVKAWIFKSELFTKTEKELIKEAIEAAPIPSVVAEVPKEDGVAEPVVEEIGEEKFMSKPTVQPPKVKEILEEEI